jgi:hypothetical protein
MNDAERELIRLTIDKANPAKVNYLQTVSLTIAVENIGTSATVVIDSLALRFQSRSSPGSSVADPHTTVVHPGGALSVAPSKLDYCTVQVRPNLLFLKYTNVFDVAISYRLSPNFVDLNSFIGLGSYLVVNAAPQLFGQVFISYKEPEDRNLANLLYDFARDAGFDPYIAPADLQTGSQIWTDKIPAAIKASKCVFVIWTPNAPKGPGVKREVKIAQQHGVRVVPLLSKGTSFDTRVFGTDTEYTAFEPDRASLQFAAVVETQRSA